MLTCPGPNLLQDFVHGLLADAEMESVADHIHLCESCLNALSNLKAQGPLSHTLRTCKGMPIEEREHPEVEALIEQVCIRVLRVDGTPWLPDGTQHSDPSASRDSNGSAPACPTLSGYEIISPLGRGGMGAVYKARHLHLGKIMAVKFLPPRDQASPHALARFRKEMKAIGLLNQAHIVQAHDAGESEGVPYLAMEYLDGRDVGKLIPPHGLPVVDACEIGRQTALGLEHAHAKGLVHRDLKPSNLMLTTAGLVKILDLGLARLREGPSIQETAGTVGRNSEQFTFAGSTMGTPDYQAPEQWLHAHDVDIRADLYSLGCTLYHLLAGQPPFADYGIDGKKKAHLAAMPPLIRERRPDVPPALARLLERLLAKAPAARPTCPKDVVDALVPYTSGASLARLLQPENSAISKNSPTAAAAVCARPPVRRPLPRFAVQLLALGIVVAAVLYVGARWDTHDVTSDLKPSSMMRWTSKAPMLAAASSFMIAESEGLIYAVGGHSNPRALDQVQVYEPATDTWRLLAPLPKPEDEGDAGRSSGAIGVIDGKLYLAGGWRADTRLPTSTLLVFDPAKNAWCARSPMPIRSGSSVAGVIAGKLYVGTYSVGSDGYQNHFHVYDPHSDEWKELAAAPNLHAGGAASVLQGKLYVVGGEYSNGALDVYDPAAGGWKTHAPIPKGRRGLSAAVWGGRLYVAGGDNSSPKVFSTLEVYDPATDTWASLPAMPTRRISMGAAIVDGTLYAIGGSDHQGSLATVEALALVDSTKR